MKIAIPMAEGRLCMHFGHCEQFALVEVDEANKVVTSTSYLTPPPHEPGVLPRWLHEQGERHHRWRNGPACSEPVLAERHHGGCRSTGRDARESRIRLPRRNTGSRAECL